MELNEIIGKVSGRVTGPLGVKNYYAVLVPLIKVNGENHLLFELRSDNLNRQPGEIAFPGGRIEPGERAEAAAVRETCEELQLPKKRVELLAQLDYLITPYHSLIYAYLGFLDIDQDKIDYNRAEVKEIFTVPLDFFLSRQPELYQVRVKREGSVDFPYHLIGDGEEYNWREGNYAVHFYQYQSYTIWGITARFISHLVGLLLQQG